MKKVLVLSAADARAGQLESFLLDTPDFSLAGSFSAPQDVLSAIRKGRVDAVFADVEFLLAKTFEGVLGAVGDGAPLWVAMSGEAALAPACFERPAVEGFLTVPFQHDRVSAVLQRLRGKFFSAAAGVNNLPQDFTFIKVDRKYVRLAFDDIWYVESVKDYIKIVCEKRSFLVHNTLANFTASLPAHRFVRLHRSYTVALDKMDWIEGNVLDVQGIKLPFSRNYISEELLRFFK